MRQAIGGTWLIQLMIVFILLFVAYITLMINYNKVIKTKNEAIAMIEKYEGLNNDSIELVNDYLKYVSYKGQGVCVNKRGVVGIYGATDLNNNTLEEAEVNKKYYYCVKKYKGAHNTNYYQISLYYRFNIPIFGDFTSFNVKGSTAHFKANDDRSYNNYYSN